MAISYVQPLLLLLASLFFLPAFGGLIDFQYCNKKGYNFGNITRVEVSPEDTQYLIVQGSTSSKSKMLYSEALELFLRIDKYRFRMARYDDIREVVDAWPLEPGKDFVLKIYREKYLRFYENYMSALTLFGNFEDSGKLQQLICIDFKLPPPQ
ncbi:unnamed protein product [Thlaspi arvense]|uniref:Uncharacterized protein n=1 Tax=Thlaspi arvense TaxID=13288 RepID=A0AAU9S8Z0_THLAR|nr:unnamed protein product [Thlaspi arvense]